MSQFYGLVSNSIKHVLSPRAASVDSNVSSSSWKMEEMSPPKEITEIGPNDLSAADSDDPISLFKVLLDEYRNILDHLPSGMVVSPAFHTLLEWHGCLHVKEGHYAGGVFKFVMNIPIDYPASPPSVYFFNAVFHPLVDPETGRLDISVAFPSWKPGRDYLVLVLAFLKKIFFKRELNSYLVSRSEFESRCEECVSESLRLVYVCHPNSPIPFSAWRKPGGPLNLLPTGESHEGLERIASKVQETLREPESTSHAKRFNSWIISEYIPSLATCAGPN